MLFSCKFVSISFVVSIVIL